MNDDRAGGHLAILPRATKVDRPSGMGRRARRGASARPGVERLEGRALLASGGDLVATWDAIALQAIRVARTPPPLAARDLAIVEVAVDDAVNSIHRTHAPDHVRVAAPKGASAEAAASAAAARTLDTLFPGQAGRFDAALASDLAAIPGGLARARGVSVGRQVADAILAWRAGDLTDATVAYTPGTAPGQWRPTPPAGAPALLPGWSRVTPFVLMDAAQFRPPGPPALTSPAYAASLDQVEALGAVDSTTRTADQTQVALFWNDAAGTATPPGHWNEIAAKVASDRHLGLSREAHVFAVLDMALADAGIACWDVKYADNFWRPVTAIPGAALDGNPATTPDPTWTPLLVTPPFPSYVSGHSTFSAAAATVLDAEFGGQTRFTIASDGLPGVTRSFRGFDQAAAEAGISRIYGGIHYSFDNKDGLALGAKVGRYVLGHTR